MGMKNKITGICGIPGGELLSCLTSHLNFSRLSKCLQTSFYFFIFQTSFYNQINKWQPTPVFLPGKIPWTEVSYKVHGVTKELDMT